MTEDPALLLPFADSPYGEPWRHAFLRSLSLLPGLDRWADRYHLIASGLSGEFTSDLVALEVDRLRPDLLQPSPAVPRLLPQRRDRLVDFVSTSAPMAAPDTRWLTVDDAQLQDGGSVPRAAGWCATRLRRTRP